MNKFTSAEQVAGAVRKDYQALPPKLCPPKLYNISRLSTRNIMTSFSAAELERLKALIQSGDLIHPADTARSSFTDLARAVAVCCGSLSACDLKTKTLVDDLGATRRHIVLVLCDGMGEAILARHLPGDSFLRTNNQEGRLTAVFPSTTPAALATLATGAWPGQHGIPGWALRDHLSCDFPGEAHSPVQMNTLGDKVFDKATGQPLAVLGYEQKDVFLAPAWSSSPSLTRELFFVSAYVGSDFTTYANSPLSGSADERSIAETAHETLGTPEGSELAVRYFAQAVDAVIERLRSADANMQSTYSYIYTAHPDKHMHTLGVAHDEVGRVMRGLDAQLGRLWSSLKQFDVALVVTADHGHVSVEPSQMISLPADVLECLEYANIGVHGTGRHGYLHCKSGLQSELCRRWAKHLSLTSHFVLIAIDDAASVGLFGPELLLLCRPRLGDFVAIATGAETLVTPRDALLYRDCPCPRVQGGHGSLTPDDMRIPFVLCVP